MGEGVRLLDSIVDYLNGRNGRRAEAHGKLANGDHHGVEGRDSCGPIRAAPWPPRFGQSTCQQQKQQEQTQRDRSGRDDSGHDDVEPVQRRKPLQHADGAGDHLDRRKMLAGVELALQRRENCAPARAARRGNNAGAPASETTPQRAASGRHFIRRPR